MRGSGEGKKEVVPWGESTADEHSPQVATKKNESTAAGAAAIKVPVAEPVPAVARQTRPAPVEVPRPPKSKAWVVWLVLLLLIAGGAAAMWYWKGHPRNWPAALEEWFSGRKAGELVEVPSGSPSPTAQPESKPPPSAPEPEKAATSEPAEGEQKQPVAPPPEAPPEKAPEKKPEKTADVKTPAAVKPPPKPAAEKKPVAKVEERNPEKAKQFYQEGNQLVREKKLAEAVASYKKALAADPAFALAHRGLGIAYAMLNRNRDACKEYEIYYKMLPADSKERPQLEAILKGCK